MSSKSSDEELAYHAVNGDPWTKEDEAAYTEFLDSTSCRPRVSVREMKLSDGSSDFFVLIRVGDREITPHVYKIRGRAEYDVAHWNYVFFGGEEPFILDFNTESNDGTD
jgi:hypothetical protein